MGYSVLQNLFESNWSPISKSVFENSKKKRVCQKKMKRGQLGRNPASSPTLLSLPFARASRSGPARLPSSHPLTARARMSAPTPPLSPSPNLARVHGRRHRRSPSSIRAIKAKICAPEHGYMKPIVPSLFAPNSLSIPPLGRPISSSEVRLGRRRVLLFPASSDDPAPSLHSLFPSLFRAHHFDTVW